MIEETAESGRRAINQLVAEILAMKPLTVEQVEKIKSARRRLAQARAWEALNSSYETVCHLKADDLFVCDIGAHIGRLYRFSKNTLNADKTIEYSWASEIAYLEDGKVWRFVQNPQLKNWNHCCQVRKVTVTVR